MNDIGVLRLPDAIDYGWGARAALPRTVSRARLAGLCNGRPVPGVDR